MRRILTVISLLLVFCRELVISNLRVTWACLGGQTAPVIFEYPVELKNEFSVTSLSYFITLTPGTIAVDYDRDRRILWIHSLFGKHQQQEEIRSIKENFEKKLRIILEGAQ